MGFGIHWCVDYPYRSLWILTLKGFYAEGLQQRRRKEITI
jgi:hypothetical protein